MSDREAFEGSAARLGYNLTMAKYETGEYLVTRTQEAWGIWQEAVDYARAQSGQGAEPVAWSWEYRGLHVSTDKAFIEKIAADGFAIRPLVFADTQPAQQGSVPGGDAWVKCRERLPEPRDSGRKAPNGILVKFDTGRITQIHDVTETLVARMKFGPRHPAKFEAPTPPRIVEWMDLDNLQPPKEGE